MYIRLRLGAYYCLDSKVDRMVNRLLPIVIDRDVITEIKPRLSNEAWSVYCNLLLYETIKYETHIPTLQTIFVESKLDKSMSLAVFNCAIQELLTTEVDGEPLLILLPPDPSLDLDGPVTEDLFSNSDTLNKTVQKLRQQLYGPGITEE